MTGAIAIFLWVPQREIDSGAEISSSSNTATQNPVIRDAATEELPSPFRESQLERAREKAQAKLNEFTALQDEFERNQYGNDGHQQRYNTIIDRANNGDKLFAVREFDTAIVEYENATEELRELQSDVHREFREWMELGNAALDERDSEAAGIAFENAGLIKPLEGSLTVGFQRLKVLPEVNELLRESERARLRNELDTAFDLIEQARALDPLTKELNERRNQILVAQAEEHLQEQLSDAYLALNNEQFDEAERLFESVLRQSSDNTAAQTGLQQTKQLRTAAYIDSLRLLAESQEKDLQLVDALSTYDEALEIDASLQFAVEGRQRIYEIVTLTNEMNRVLQDPGSLSSDQQFEKAQESLNSARKYENHSEEYDRTLAEFAAIVAEASEYYTLILISDDATEVTLTTVGNLGTFTRHEVSLRAGRYELLGSQDGCKDVRRTITVERHMSPVSIVCEKRI